MADAVFKLEVNADDSADRFSDRIVSNLKRDLNLLNVSSKLKINPAEAKLNLAAQGVSATKFLGLSGKSSGAMETGVAEEGMGMAGMLKMLGIMGLIYAAVADFPMVTAIMKLIKVILTLLLLPLIPILKPVLLALSEMAKNLIPIMTEIMKVFEKAFEPLNAEVTFISGIISDVVNWLIAIWNDITSLDFGKLATDLIMGLASVLNALPVFSFLQSVLSSLVSALSSIAGVLGFSFSAPSSSGGGGVSDNRSSEQIFDDLFNNPFGFAGFQTGTSSVPNTGMYMLHRGERVVSATEGDNKSNNSVTVTVNNPTFNKDMDVKDLVREIERRIGKDMRRRVSYVG